MANLPDPDRAGSVFAFDTLTAPEFCRATVDVAGREYPPDDKPSQAGDLVTLGCNLMADHEPAGQHFDEPNWLWWSAPDGSGN